MSSPNAVLLHLPSRSPSPPLLSNISPRFSDASQMTPTANEDESGLSEKGCTILKYAQGVARGHWRASTPGRKVREEGSSDTCVKAFVADVGYYTGRLLKHNLAGRFCCTCKRGGIKCIFYCLLTWRSVLVVFRYQTQKTGLDLYSPWNNVLSTSHTCAVPFM